MTVRASEEEQRDALLDAEQRDAGQPAGVHDVLVQERVTHKEQGSMIRRYITWRNQHAADGCLREVVAKANVAWIRVI
ncbi:hypothetical protein ACF1GW_18095 [Streptomyces achromogenes]|uniref:hypothetical protein n=1 Tax=Streptomyces achromogenes TaxID=67255 RepID=UPI0037026CD6